MLDNFELEALRRTQLELPLPNSAFDQEADYGELGIPVGGSNMETIDGYEAMHAIRKGRSAKGDTVGQRQIIHTLFGIAT